MDSNQEEKGSQVGDRIRIWAFEKYGSVSALCRALGKVTSYLNPYISGKSMPGAVLLHQLRSLGCNTEWLLSGNGDMNLSATMVAEENEKYKPFSIDVDAEDNTSGDDVEKVVFDSKDDVMLLKDMLRISVRQIATLEGENAAIRSGTIRYLKELQKKYPDEETKNLLDEIDMYLRGFQNPNSQLRLSK